jgi:hypothetical protein
MATCVKENFPSRFEIKPIHGRNWPLLLTKDQTQRRDPSAEYRQRGEMSPALAQSASIFLLKSHSSRR